MICDRSRAVLDVRWWRLEGCETLIIDDRYIRVTATPCHFGGKRYWLVCPSCDRRCVALYSNFQCRICIRGRYSTEAMSRIDRLIDRSRKLRRKLGQRSFRLIDLPPPKPKLMRWHTYLRIRAEIMAIEAEIFGQWRREMRMT